MKLHKKGIEYLLAIGCFEDDAKDQFEQFLAIIQERDRHRNSLHELNNNDSSGGDDEEECGEDEKSCDDEEVEEEGEEDAEEAEGKDIEEEELEGDDIDVDGVGTRTNAAV